tara:strand:+ start:2190 stop:2387 length:198 start_codon:yes stop_codon:yes gene_type:complete
MNDQPEFTMSNEELAEAIQQARALMSRSGCESDLFKKLQGHLFDLLEIQRARAAMLTLPEQTNPE